MGSSTNLNIFHTQKIVAQQFPTFLEIKNSESGLTWLDLGILSNHFCDFAGISIII